MKEIVKAAAARRNASELQETAIPERIYAPSGS